MLSSNQKIKIKDFKGFYKKGKKNTSKNLRSSIIYSNVKCSPLYAVIIDKKTVKTAVSRNKNKRKIYKILRQLYPQFSFIKYGYIFIKKNITNIKNEDILKEILGHLNNKT